jgi:hypothetical protein
MEKTAYMLSNRDGKDGHALAEATIIVTSS